VHDTDHPGVMNTYLIATKHPISLLQGTDAPKAVLENHHAAMALALLERPELDFLCNLEPEERKRFKEFIHENVINTDVTTTMGAAKQFGGQSSNARRPSTTVVDFERAVRQSKSTEKAEESTGPSVAQVMCLIIKAADISNPARRLSVYERWIDGVMTEFFVQGDCEREQGLPISMNCDRETVVLAKAQVGFISFLVGPLFTAISSYAPAIKPICDQLDANLAHFKALADA